MIEAPHPMCDTLSAEESNQFDIDLTETDVGIINRLRVRACTAAFIADDLDLNQSYVRQRLNRLVEHEHVVRIHHGLYEPVRCDYCTDFALPHHKIITNRLPPEPMKSVGRGEEAPEGDVDLVQFKLCTSCHEDWETKPWDVQQDMLGEISYENF